MRCALVLIILFAGSACDLFAAAPWQAGFAKVDVTPKEPVRMSGYGNRDHPSEGIDTPLFVGAVALKHGQDPPHVLVSVDTIGLPGVLVRELTQQIERRHRVPRQRIVLASTHTHTGPHLVSELSNLFAVELTPREIDAGTRYRKQLSEAILSAVEQSLGSLAPATLAYGVGETNFAANRRVLKDGRWSGFGVQSDGPVDHSVSVLRISGEDGQIRGVVFNYACHCTTLEGDYYRINGDWAGYAAANLEAAFPGAVALCTVGCGADANPNPRGTREQSEMHGSKLSQEVARVVTSEMKPIDRPITATFGHAGLSFDLPTIEALKQRDNDPVVQVRRHAKHFQEVNEREGRLPATYPVPIQTWRFGDQLSMIFLGGEVVADYALRLKRELPSQPLWITAYANDVLGYIASERMRAEGGYEYDFSAIYYNLSGPWAAGTEDLLIRRIHEQLNLRGPQPPLEPVEALQSIAVPPGYEVQLVAAEPLVADPINLAFGHDGSLWVVEMGAYPLGAERPAENGRVKRLTDTNGDGVFDQASVFLEGLDYPTGVHPWRDGVIVLAAPEIFFARDRDGDGRADEREVLYRGLAAGNPQHRASGFAYGLDHSLHCASGDNIGVVTAVRTGEKLNASGHDLQIFPESGRMAAISGRSQYMRARNDWGDWFGSDNSRPMYHFPIEDRYLARNPAARYSDNQQQLFDPPVAPPVFPLSDTDRFNDLFAANRFTSACSAVVVRSGLLGEELAGAALVCEPVHNLVHRAQLVQQGSTYRAVRAESEQRSEFFRSSDPWCRPVRATTGPDGMIWIVDMYRAVIEHPEWIPQAWQQQIDLRAGADRGRIYRIVPAKTAVQIRLPDLSKLSSDELVALLTADGGTLRDMAQQEILQRGDKSVVAALRTVAASSSSAPARVHTLWILHGLQELRDAELSAALADEHPGVVRNAILLAEPRIAESITLLQALCKQADHPDPRARLQLALSLGESTAPAAGAALAKLVPHAADDPWLAQAIVSSSKHHSIAVLEQFLAQLRNSGKSVNTAPRHVSTIANLIATASANGADATALVGRTLAEADPNADWVYPLAAAWAQTFDRGSNSQTASRQEILAVYQKAKSSAMDNATAPNLRCQALQLFARSLGAEAQEQGMLCHLLSPTTPLEVQLAAVERLAAFRDRQSVEQLVERWPNLSYAVRDAAAMQFCSSFAAMDALIEALETGVILPSDLSPSVRQTLRQSGSHSLQARINHVLGKSAPAGQELIQQYLQFQKDALAAADISRGHDLFRKHCAVCHVPDSAGRATGPDLSNLTDRSRAAFTESILAPNRAVEPQYRGVVLLLTNGQVLTGIMAEEAGDTVTLALADGRRQTVQRSEIDDFRDTGISFMPDGFAQQLDPGMLRDLVEYLQSETFAQTMAMP